MSSQWNRRSVIAAVGTLGVAAVLGKPGHVFGADATVVPAHRYPASPYYKRIGFFSRLPGISADEFVKHWVDIHAQLFKPTPGVVKYRLNIVDPLRSQNTPYDGATEVWFQNERAFHASYQSESFEKIRADGKLFIKPRDAQPRPTLATTEYVILEPPTGPTRPKVKRIGVLPRNPRVPYADFLHQWLDVHAPDYIKNVPGIRGYTINAVHESDTGPWAGYASLWWDDQASYDAAARVDPAAASGNFRIGRQPSPQAVADGNAGAVKFMSVLVTERVII